MDEKQQPDKIAAEAVGERLGSDPPDAVRHPEISQEEVARKLAPAPAPQASVAEKSAESMGERVGDAYANTGSDRVQRSGRDVQPQASGTMDRALDLGRDAAQSISRQFQEQPVIMALMGTALGYLAGALIHSRR
ncbi:MAG: hypothetical protein JO007_12890 [Alphaproteobacteria bacterium]|nr:hypothetical protein [Alphaproteobacteria bacterium]